MLLNCFQYVLPVYGKGIDPAGSVSGVHPKVSEMELPDELGVIQEIYEGNGDQSVILLQDAHTLFEAQKSIQKIIPYFQKQYGLRLIALEGGAGRVEPLLFRAFPDQAALEQVFSGYLERGELSGAIAASVLNPEGADYYGIEDPQLYEQGIKAFHEAQKRKTNLLIRVRQMEERLGKRKKRYYPARLYELDGLLNQFEGKNENFIPLIQKLSHLQVPDKKQYPHLDSLFQAVKVGQEDPASENAPPLPEMRADAFFKEWKAYTAEIKNKFLTTPSLRRLDEMTSQLAMLKRLVSLELTREDWDLLQKKSWPQLNSRSLQPNFRFYQITLQRDEIFFKNLKLLMRSKNQTISLFLAGGFHTGGMIERLKREGISYALVSPRISRLPEDTPYMRVMRGDVSWKNYFRAKSGKVNLYEAFAFGARDRLLGESHVPVKSWRDEIIRTLARRGEIGKAGQYTKVLEQTASQGVGSDEGPVRMDPLNLRFERFLSRLKKLVAGNKLTHANLVELINAAHVMPVLNVGSGIPSFSLSSGLVIGNVPAAGSKVPLQHSASYLLNRSELREETGLPGSFQPEIENITQALMREDFEKAIREIDDFDRDKLESLHKLGNLKLKRWVLYWMESARETAARFLEFKATGISPNPESTDFSNFVSGSRRAVILPFSFVDEQAYRLIEWARESEKVTVVIANPIQELGDLPYYILTGDQETALKVTALFRQFKNDSTNEAFRAELAGLLGYPEEELTKYFGASALPKNRITAAEVSHFWADPKLDYLKHLVLRYKDVAGIGGVVQRLSGYRALEMKKSFHEVGGELFSIEKLEEYFSKDYEVKVLALGFFIGFREFDAAIYLKPKVPAQNNGSMFEEGIYFIEAKEDDSLDLNSVLEETLYQQVPPQMENLEYAAALGIPVRGILVAAGGRNSDTHSADGRFLVKKAGIPAEKILELPEWQRPEKMLPVYTVVLPAYDVENHPSVDGIRANIPDADLVKAWSHQPMDILDLARSGLFQNEWPPKNKASSDAFHELRRREHKRYLMMKKQQEERKKRILEQARSEQVREDEAIRWADLLRNAGIADAGVDRILADYFYQRQVSLETLRRNLYRQYWVPRVSQEGDASTRVSTVTADPQGAWQWIISQVSKKASTREKQNKRTLEALDPRQATLSEKKTVRSKWPPINWEVQEVVEEKIQSEVAGKSEGTGPLTENSGWLYSFAERKEVVNQGGDPISRTDVAPVLEEYFALVKGQPASERKQYFSRLRNRLQESVRIKGRQATWDLLKNRKWDELDETVSIRSEVRTNSPRDGGSWKRILETLDGTVNLEELQAIEQHVREILSESFTPDLVASYFDLDEPQDPLFPKFISNQSKEAIRLNLKRGRLRTFVMLKVLGVPFDMKESFALAADRSQFVDINPSFGKDRLALLIDTGESPDLNMVIVRPFAGELSINETTAWVRGGWVVENGMPVWVRRFKKPAAVHLFDLPVNGHLDRHRRQLSRRGIPEAFAVENSLLRDFGHKSAVYALIDEMNLNIRHPRYTLWEIGSGTNRHALRMSLSAALEEIAPSLVIKPNAGTKGQGIYFADQTDSDLDRRRLVQNLLKTADENRHHTFLGEEKIPVLPIRIREDGRLKNMAWAIRLILSRDPETGGIQIPVRYVRLQEGYIHAGEEAQKYWTVDETFNFLGLKQEERERLNQSLEHAARALLEGIEARSAQTVPALSVDFFVTPEYKIVFNEIGFQFGGRYRHNYLLSREEKQKFGSEKLDPYELERLKRRAAVKRSEIRGRHASVILERDWDRLSDRLVEAFLRERAPLTAEWDGLQRLLKSQNWRETERHLRSAYRRLTGNRRSSIGGGHSSLSALTLEPSIRQFIRKKPRAFFRMLQGLGRRSETVPRVDQGLSVAVHAPLIPDKKNERKALIELMRNQNGYFILPFQRVSLQKEKIRKDTLAREIYQMASPTLGERFRPVGFVGDLDYRLLQRKAAQGSLRSGLVTLMADGSLRIPDEKKAKSLAFVIEPEILALLKLTDVVRLLQVIGSAPDSLREFYLRQLDLYPDEKTGVRWIGKSFINRLNEMAKQVDAVMGSA